ncbi:MAG: DUF1249 domain-containing protein [Candidatus Azotimanducaceae bacterium WSBS_2022_MAG_OTU7]
MTNRYLYVPDLVADMAECDANYIRLRQLFPDMDSEDDIEFGIQTRTEEGATVVIKIQERCPFTTMAVVSVSSENDKPFIKWPSLELRIYHDVFSAEVVRFERHRNFRFRYLTPNEQMFQPDEKSQINKYLGELLTYCIEHGYSLEPLEFS